MADLRLAGNAFDNARNILSQYLTDSGYTGSMEDGTGIADAVIRPLALLYVVFAQMADKAQAYQSIAKAKELRASLTDDEYDSIVDSLLSNWFISRNPGKPSTGLVRLWFDRPLDFLALNEGDSLGSAEDTPLLAQQSMAFAPEHFSMYLNTTTNLTEYYVDIPACTSENTDVVITRGTAVDGSIPDIYFIRMDIPADFTPGVVKENSEDFISRSDQSITTRELVTRRAYKTVLMDEFDEIFRLYVAGYGSPEQIRDVVEFQNVTVHVGNKADIYIAGKLTTYATEAVIRDDGAAVVSNMSDRACLLLPLDAPRVLNADEFLWGCVGGEPPVLDVQADPARAGEVVPVTWLGNPAVADVTDYIRQEDRRLMTYDPRVKGMFPVLLSMRLSVSRVSDAQDDAPAIRAAVIAYVETVTKSGASWNESEMLAAIHTACPNVKRVTTPITGEARLFDPRSGAVLSVPLENTLSRDNFDPDASPQITDNTLQLHTAEEYIEIEWA